MAIALETLRHKVMAQKQAVPELYGEVDFTLTPERFCTDPNAATLLPANYARRLRGDLLADHQRVERARLYTMLGDTVCDRYAALMRHGYSMRDLIMLLHQACEKGVENVDKAPQQLHDFIHSMEQVPDWIDMDLVREGQRVGRTYMAILTPFAIRGAFVATFMNKYSGLPMALTGALSKKDSSTQRINETASFFTAATLPHSLDRQGNAFLAAAMVRLMHSVVRFNLLTRSDKWDLSVYGIPVPQVDQMPAGNMPSFLNAARVMRTGKKHFTRQQRATTELCRYQSYLLGLPKDLLPPDPKGIFDTMVAYTGTLRDGYDEATCGQLVKSTMKAYRPPKKRLRDRLYNQVETSFSKVFFNRVFLQGGSKYRARLMGVEPKPLDYALFAAANSFIMPQLVAHRLAVNMPLVDGVADAFLVHRIKYLLGQYGHAEYITDAKQYADRDNKAGRNNKAAPPIFSRVRRRGQPA